MTQRIKKAPKAKLTVYCPGCHTTDHKAGAFRCVHCREILVQVPAEERRTNPTGFEDGFAVTLTNGEIILFQDQD